jgi:putative hemolysin
MMNQTQPDRLFNLNVAFKDPLQNRLFSLVKGPLEHFLAFPRMNRAYADISEMGDNRPFPDKVLDKLNVAYDLTAEDISRLMTIPSGPVIVVANHPFGGIEGIILASLLRSLRCDVKFMANYLLNAIPEMREMLISVNPFKGGTSVRDNIRPIRESIEWVRNGGMLVVFPAGAVSHFDARKGVITDPAWSPSIARIIRKTGAPAIPVFFQGTNSAAFHMAGMVHPVLRTAMLPNELFNKNRGSIQVRVGDLVPIAKLQAFDRDEDMTAYLRLRTYVLAHRGDKAAVPGIAAFIRRAKHDSYGAIMPPQNPDVMAEEIRRLPSSQTLVESNEHAVIQATSDQIPHLLLEIGRLREITFRAVGEGTGKAVDIDRFDHSYTHLFIWNREKKEVVGAYRLGRTDELIRQKGVRGLYTSTLFRYKPGFFEYLGPALELGRSFIRPEYQKSFAPLLLLWKGIGRFIVDNPHYKTLFGPVSISDEYQALSRQFLVSYLKMTRYRSDLAGFVKPKKPFPAKSLKGWDIDAAIRLLKDDVENVSDLISCMEADRKGVPILLKQYLKLGGEIAGFNVDTAFCNVLDGLIIVDLTRTEPRMLERYLGKDGSRQFLDHHEALNRERHATCA